MSRPVVVRRAQELRSLVASWKEAGEKVALVPTMGSLHEGHLALVERASLRADRIVVSIFVNPLQFGKGEDFDRYPRDVDADVEYLTDKGVDVVFAPGLEDIYPQGVDAVEQVKAGPVGETFEGATRPGHFDGVLTVVKALCEIAQPDVAVFGQKDAQQLFLVSSMVETHQLPVVIEAVETVRAADGVALSSRNAFLSTTERQEATALPMALSAATKHTSVVEALEHAHAVLHKHPNVVLDYLDVVDPKTFLPMRAGNPARDALMIVAARVGTTRLIDNQRFPIHQ
jgi:pantoate--beta-alanine ligase